MSAAEARLHRAGQHGRADGQAAGRLARRADRLRRARRGDDPAGRARRTLAATASPTSPRRRRHQRHRAQRRAGARRRRRARGARRRPGTVIAIHSTISAGQRRSTRRTGCGRRGHIVDAPVSGGAGRRTRASWRSWSAAATRRSTLAASRSPCSARWSCTSARSGSGTNAKMARNLITFVGFAAVGEAQRLAEAAGLDLAQAGRGGAALRRASPAVRRDHAARATPGRCPMTTDCGPSSSTPPRSGPRTCTSPSVLAAEHGLDAPFAELGERWLRIALGLDAHPAPVDERGAIAGPARASRTGRARPRAAAGRSAHRPRPGWRT